MESHDFFEALGKSNEEIRTMTAEISFPLIANRAMITARIVLTMEVYLMQWREREYGR